MEPQPYFRQTRIGANTWLFAAYDPVYKQYHQVVVKDPVQPVSVGFQYIPGPDLLTIGFTDAAGRLLSRQTFTIPKEER